MMMMSVVSNMTIARRVMLWGLAMLGASMVIAPTFARADQPFIAGSTPKTIATTVPPNGDQNPYGIVTVPTSVGAPAQRRSTYRTISAAAAAASRRNAIGTVPA